MTLATFLEQKYEEQEEHNQAMQWLVATILLDCAGSLQDGFEMNRHGIVSVTVNGFLVIPVIPPLQQSPQGDSTKAVVMKQVMRSQ